MEKNPEPMGPPYKAESAKRGKAILRENDLQERVRVRREKERERAMSIRARKHGHE